MKKTRIVLMMLSIIAVFALSCQSWPKNLQPLYYLKKPSIIVYLDPETNCANYKTFSVVPYSVINKEPKQESIAEKQIMFFIRNQLESRNYQFVSYDETPDFVITVNYDCKYNQQYIPPERVTMPKYIPGQTITSYMTTTHSGDARLWGNYTSTTAISTEIPGKWIEETYTRPGYTVGYYYPSATMTACEKAGSKEIWKASGNAISNYEDFRISGQLLLSGMLNKFPICNNTATNYTDERLKLTYIIATVDGNNYYPTIWRPDDETAAPNKDFKMGDMIYSINDEPTVNKTYSQIRKMLSGLKGTELSIKFRRDFKPEEIKLKI
ncbi:MAG: DUF4136 domain-containing protein [Planctomycetota bacterium]